MARNVTGELCAKSVWNKANSFYSVYVASNILTQLMRSFHLAFFILCKIVMSATDGRAKC